MLTYYRIVHVVPFLLYYCCIWRHAWIEIFEGTHHLEPANNLTYGHEGYVESPASCSVVGIKSNPDRVLWCYDTMGSHTTAVYQWVAKLLCSRQHNMVLGTSW